MCIWMTAKYFMPLFKRSNMLYNLLRMCFIHDKNIFYVLNLRRKLYYTRLGSHTFWFRHWQRNSPEKYKWSEWKCDLVEMNKLSGKF